MPSEITQFYEEGFVDGAEQCMSCGMHHTEMAKEGRLFMQCTRCKKAYYCSVKCFNDDMDRHSEYCLKAVLVCKEPKIRKQDDIDMTKAEREAAKDPKKKIVKPEATNEIPKSPKSPSTPLKKKKSTKKKKKSENSNNDSFNLIQIVETTDADITHSEGTENHEGDGNAPAEVSPKKQLSEKSKAKEGPVDTSLPKSSSDKENSKASKTKSSKGSDGKHKKASKKPVEVEDDMDQVRAQVEAFANHDDDLDGSANINCTDRFGNSASKLDHSPKPDSSARFDLSQMQAPEEQEKTLELEEESDDDSETTMTWSESDFYEYVEVEKYVDGRRYHIRRKDGIYQPWTGNDSLTEINYDDDEAREHVSNKQQQATKTKQDRPPRPTEVMDDETRRRLNVLCRELEEEEKIAREQLLLKKVQAPEKAKKIEWTKPEWAVKPPIQRKRSYVELEVALRHREQSKEEQAKWVPEWILRSPLRKPKHERHLDKKEKELKKHTPEWIQNNPLKKTYRRDRHGHLVEENEPSMSEAGSNSLTEVKLNESKTLEASCNASLTFTKPEWVENSPLKRSARKLTGSALEQTDIAEGGNSFSELKSVDAVRNVDTSWAEPEWVKNNRLRRSIKKETLEGSISELCGASVTNLDHSKVASLHESFSVREGTETSEVKNSKPHWVIQSPLRRTEKGQALQKSGSLRRVHALAKVETTKQAVTWEKPEWVQSSPLKPPKKPVKEKPSPGFNDSKSGLNDSKAVDAKSQERKSSAIQKMSVPTL